MGVPLNIDWQQILLHLFNFLILGTGLYFLLYKPVQKFMQKRMDYYASLKEQAARDTAKAEALKAEYEQRLADSQQEISQQKTEAITKATAETQQVLHQAKAQADKIIADAQKEALAQKKQITESTQREVAKMIITAAEKLMIQNCNFDNDMAIYDKFLTSAKEGTYSSGQTE